MIDQFLGIPYAEPPVGELRFRKPVPSKPWYPTTLDALEFASPCAQANGSMPPAPWLVEREKLREDCLYLNVWTPMERTEDLGVLVWFHGGGFRTGTASSPLYNSKTLAAVGSIVVVTVNFRLGFLGFLYTGPGTSTGNYLLWDQHLCLRWIRDNIARFGGDPGRVTVYGESAGSIGISSLLLSPRNTGLIHRAIMASGSNYWLHPPQNKVGPAFVDRVAKAVGCLTPSYPSSKSHPAEVVNCLRFVSVEDLMHAEDTEFMDQLVPFSPAHGDDFLPIPELMAVNKGLIIPLESLMTGLMTEEGSVFAYFKDPVLLGSQKAPKFTRTQASQFVGRHYLNFLPITTQMMVNGAFQQKVRSGSDWTGVWRSVVDSIGDFIINCPTKFFAEAFAKLNRPVYFYVVDYPSKTWPAWFGATHFEELQFVFGMPFRFPERYTEDDRAQSMHLMKIVSSYVSNGKPELPDGMEYPVFTKEQPMHVVLNARNTSVGSAFHEEGCKVYRSIYQMLGVPTP
ncbi:hypothetical protein HPB47_021037 [Ixodes persulcatus]|uniref:Uncharacterized protein n=1 Tax=Ixodes persulcatus TaxID=34615 RepID=A0AC60QFQ3_IXOPE|nr:hypothetical protein HPB47_021037 [Ixodes persulcatus]